MADDADKNDDAASDASVPGAGADPPALALGDGALSELEYDGDDNGPTTPQRGDAADAKSCAGKSSVSSSVSLVMSYRSHEIGRLRHGVLQRALANILRRKA